MPLRLHEPIVSAGKKTEKKNMSDHIASLEAHLADNCYENDSAYARKLQKVRHDEPSVIHNVPQEELLYMRVKGLSWKDIEEADKVRERSKKAAFHVFFFVLSCLLCFLFFKAYKRYQEITAVETTSLSNEFFVSTDKPGVLNSTHEWLDARPTEDSEPRGRNCSSSDSAHDSRCRSGSGSGSGSDADWGTESGSGEKIPRELQHPLDDHDSTSVPFPSTTSISPDSSTVSTNAGSWVDITEMSTAARTATDIEEIT